MFGFLKGTLPFLKTCGLGALPGKMLFVRIIENDKIYAYFRSIYG